ncbi:major facilitator superfamily domain-containing protein 9-like isoform X2 [Tubulanus polymorphus]
MKMVQPTTVVYIISFLDLFAISMFIPLLSKHAFSMGASPTDIGALGFIYGILQFLSSPVVGTYSDKFGRKSVLCSCILLTSCGYYMLGLSTTVALLWASRILPGCFKHTQNLLRAYLAKNVPAKLHSQVFSRQNAFGNVGFVIGPVLGGHFTDNLVNGYSTTTIIGASILVLTAVFARLFLPDDISGSDVAVGVADELSQHRPNRGIVNYFRHRSWRQLWHVFLIKFLLGTSSLMFREISPVLLYQRHKPSNTILGMVISSANALSVLSSFFVEMVANAKWYKSNNERLLLHMIGLHVISMSGLLMAPFLWMFVCIQIPYRLCQAVTRISVVNMLIKYGGKEDSGTLMGLGQSVLSISRIFAPVIYGIIHHATESVPLAGVPAVMLAVSAFMIVCRQGHESKGHSLSKAN